MAYIVFIIINLCQYDYYNKNNYHCLIFQLFILYQIQEYQGVTLIIHFDKKKKKEGLGKYSD